MVVVGGGVLTLSVLQFRFSHQDNSHYINETGPSEIFKASSGGSPALPVIQPSSSCPPPTPRPPPPSLGTPSPGRPTCAKRADESIMHERPAAASHTPEEQEMTSRTHTRTRSLGGMNTCGVKCEKSMGQFSPPG